MKKKMLSLAQAVDYLETTRGIKVKRQSIYNYMQRHLTDCEKLDGKERPILWFIPTTLLDNYKPSALHQTNGQHPKKSSA